MTHLISTEYSRGKTRRNIYSLMRSEFGAKGFTRTKIFGQAFTHRKILYRILVQLCKNPCSQYNQCVWISLYYLNNKINTEPID